MTPAIYFPSTAEMGWEAAYFCMPQQHPDHYPVSDGAVTIKPFHLCPRKKERVKRHLRNFSDTHRHHFLIPVLFQIIQPVVSIAKDKLLVIDFLHIFP